MSTFFPFCSQEIVENYRNLLRMQNGFKCIIFAVAIVVFGIDKRMKQKITWQKLLTYCFNSILLLLLLLFVPYIYNVWLRNKSFIRVIAKITIVPTERRIERRPQKTLNPKIRLSEYMVGKDAKSEARFLWNRWPVYARARMNMYTHTQRLEWRSLAIIFIWNETVHICEFRDSAQYRSSHNTQHIATM